MPLPKPKTFTMPHTGRQIVKPGPEKPQYQLKAEPAAPFPGAPLVPTGNPMVDGVGPAAYALRVEEPDLNHAGKPRIHTFIGTSPLHRAIPNLTMDEMAERIHDTVTHARNLCDNVQWSPMDATRTVCVPMPSSRIVSSRTGPRSGPRCAQWATRCPPTRNTTAT